MNASYTIAWLIKWGSVFAVFVGIFAVWRLWRRPEQYRKVLAILLTVIILVCSYARFIEPQMITIHHEQIDIDFLSEDDTPIKIALIADPHLGIYKSPRFLERVVKNINKLEPDLVLIPGDFYYKPHPDELTNLFDGLAELNAPVFATAGNHDYYDDSIGRYYEELKTNLKNAGINFLENTASVVKIRNTELKIIGFGDIWFEDIRNHLDLLGNSKETDNIITLVHNPDSIFHFPNSNSDLTVAGHTHGGQIRIPFFYKSQIPTEGDFDWGYSQEATTQLFITSGLGEVNLPARLFRPPQIALLELY